MDEAAPDDYRSDYQITLELKDVPFFEVLRWLANATGRRLQEAAGVVTLSKHQGIIEDWGTREHPVSPKVLKALGVAENSSPRDLRAKFKQFGVSCEPWHIASLTRVSRPTSSTPKELKEKPTL
jgi:hypothetical protein